MSQSFVFSQKDSRRHELLKELTLPKKTRGTIYIALQDDTLHRSIYEACRSVGIVPIIDRVEHFIGLDVFVWDGQAPLLWSLPQLLWYGVVPVILKTSPYTWLFSEFNPMQFEGNAFIYETLETFPLFEKIIRAFENMRYAGDRRVLLKNVIQTWPQAEELLVWRGQ